MVDHLWDTSWKFNSLPLKIYRAPKRKEGSSSSPIFFQERLVSYTSTIGAMGLVYLPPFTIKNQPTKIGR